MYLFLSSEAQGSASDVISEIQRKIEKAIPVVFDKSNPAINSERYGSEFESIAIISTCLSKPWLNDMGWKERKLIKRKTRKADIRLFIDYEKFIELPYEKQEEMYIDHLIQSINVVKEKSKGDFNGDALITDILDALNKKYLIK